MKSVFLWISSLAALLFFALCLMAAILQIRVSPFQVSGILFTAGALASFACFGALNPVVARKFGLASSRGKRIGVVFIGSIVAFGLFFAGVAAGPEDVSLSKDQIIEAAKNDEISVTPDQIDSATKCYNDQARKIREEKRNLNEEGFDVIKSLRINSCLAEARMSSQQ